MKGNWPYSLPKNAGLIYQTIVTAEDYMEPEVYNNLKPIPKKEIESPMIVFFMLKHFNNKKLSSQMWLFQGFCQ
jgi:hypothetical protein